MSTRILIRNGLIAVVAAGILATVLMALAGNVEAQTAPTVSVGDARCWRSLLQTDDLLCIGRYNLPQQTTAIPAPVAAAEAWCQYLQNQAGCTSTAGAVVPSEPTSLQYAVLSAWFTLCSLDVGEIGCTGHYLSTTSTTLYSQDQVPRISHGLIGHYFEPGHGIAWGHGSAPFVNACIEPTSDFSTTSTPACTRVNFVNNTNTQAAQRGQLEDDIVAMIVDVQAQRGLPRNTYTTRGKINAAGRVIALEAYPYLDSIACPAFQTCGQQAVLTPYSGTPAGVVVLETRIAGTATAQPFGQRAERAGQEWGISGGFWTTVIFMGLGLIAATGVFRFIGDTESGTKDALPLAVITFISVTYLGIFLGGPSLSVVIVSTVIMATAAGWFVLSKIPSG